MNTQALVTEVKANAYLMLYEIRQRERNEIRHGNSVGDRTSCTRDSTKSIEMCLGCSDICNQDPDCYG